MKKILSVLFLVLSVFAVSGCTKNYKTVSEYAVAMNEVKNKLGDYTIEATMLTDGKETTVKSYIRGDVWRTDISEDNGTTYSSGAFSDGSELVSFDYKTKMGLVIPFMESKDKNKNMTEAQMKVLLKATNPVGALLVWDVAIPELMKEPNNLEQTDEIVNNAWQFKEITEKNNYKCRMLTYKNLEGSEICVSDKYGIAVYAKMYNEETKKTATVNVKNIDNSTIQENNLKLPEGIKKMSMMDLFKGMFGQMAGK